MIRKLPTPTELEWPPMLTLLLTRVCSCPFTLAKLVTRVLARVSRAPSRLGCNLSVLKLLETRGVSPVTASSSRPESPSVQNSDGAGY